MAFASSCIVADPPEYRTALQTRPVLDVYSAAPTATHALTVLTQPATIHNFSVPFRSEDAGEELRALFFIDYEMPGEDRLNSQKIPPSTYDNESREWKYPWIPSTTPGCHYLTLVMAHRSTFQDADEDELIPALAADDAAMVTWVVSVNPKDPASSTLENCPTKEPIVP